MATYPIWSAFQQIFVQAQIWHSIHHFFNEVKVFQLSVILAALSLSLFIRAHYTFAGHCGLQSEYLNFYTVKPTTLRWLGQPIIASMIHVGFWILWRRWHPHCSVYCCTRSQWNKKLQFGMTDIGRDASILQYEANGEAGSAGVCASVFASLGWCNSHQNLATKCSSNQALLQASRRMPGPLWGNTPFWVPGLYPKIERVLWPALTVFYVPRDHQGFLKPLLHCKFIWWWFTYYVCVHVTTGFVHLCAWYCILAV
jgi:hypothetical protein